MKEIKKKIEHKILNKLKGRSFNGRQNIRLGLRLMVGKYLVSYFRNKKERYLLHEKSVFNTENVEMELSQPSGKNLYLESLPEFLP